MAQNNNSEETPIIQPDLADDRDEDVRLTVESGVGDRLRKAREEQFKTREDIARELHVRTEYVQALEEEDYDRLPEVIYARGYVRNYARLVGLPPDELLAQLHYVGTETPQVLPRTSSVDDIHQGDGWVRWLTYLLVLAVVGLGVFWAYDQFLAERSTLDLGDSEVAPGGMDRAETGPVTDLAVVSAERLERLRQGDQVDPPPDSAEIPEPLLMEPPGAPEEGGVTEASLAGGNDAEPVAVSTTLPEGHAELAASFDERSWVEIYDADGERLLYDSLSEGDDFSVTGEPPFRVVLGNPAGARIELNGTPYDMSHVDPTGVARLQIGGED